MLTAAVALQTGLSPASPVGTAPPSAAEGLADATAAMSIAGEMAAAAVPTTPKSPPAAVPTTPKSPPAKPPSAVTSSPPAHIRVDEKLTTALPPPPADTGLANEEEEEVHCQPTLFIISR
jgi:hypothetical protein